jgi:hypothetical protein
LGKKKFPCTSFISPLPLIFAKNHDQKQKPLLHD